ncbi:unnamed protein product [Notodromas monacha]|uniref:Sodium/hydrogen exchanger n=1 Tax=Notodromas monacha TaxID=399045 RepID=A0A7R9BBF1_9CRUS|nr:unnamed protein product [Notodromas monacha]CAG0912206.1 unnamed protein product [Notodromas monacha]
MKNGSLIVARSFYCALCGQKVASYQRLISLDLVLFFLSGFHMTEYLSKIFPESCLLIVVGVVVGLLLYYTDAANGTMLTPDVFLFYMLPPIILDAGYFMPNRLFFDHLGTILLMAVVGTIFNSMAVGGSLYLVGTTGIFEEVPLLPALLFGSLVSAVDPVAVLALFDELSVNEVLNIVVFGESLLNDAVTVVLYHMFEAYTVIGENNLHFTDILKGIASFFVISLGGTIIGVIWGFLTGFITRFTEHARVIEPVFVFVMAYLAYLNAEIFHLSGILSTTFCGITMKNYVVANVSQKSQTTLKYTMKMLSSSSETIIFMLLGVSTVHDEHVWDTWFVIFTLLFCTVYRALGVVLLTAIANRFRLHKLERVEKFVMAYGGLRGAVAFALVLLIDENHVKQKHMFVTTTIAVIYFTVFVQGITIKPLVQILGVRRAEKRKKTMNERVHERMIDHMMAGIEELIGHTGNYYWREKFKYYDQKYIRPALLRERHVAEPKILDTFSKLKMRDAKSYAELNATASTADIQTMANMFKHVHPSVSGLAWGRRRSSSLTGQLGVQINSSTTSLGGLLLDSGATAALGKEKFRHLMRDSVAGCGGSSPVVIDPRGAVAQTRYQYPAPLVNKFALRGASPDSLPPPYSTQATAHWRRPERHNDTDTDVDADLPFASTSSGGSTRRRVSGSLGAKSSAPSFALLAVPSALATGPGAAPLTNTQNWYPTLTHTAYLQAAGEWNLDMKELEYSPSTRDMDDARINRLLDASMLRPYRRHNRGVRYNRHAVSDREMPGMSHHKTYAHMRRLISEHAAEKARRKPDRRGDDSPDGADDGGIGAAVTSNGRDKCKVVSFAPQVRGTVAASPPKGHPPPTPKIVVQGPNGGKGKVVVKAKKAVGVGWRLRRPKSVLSHVMEPTASDYSTLLLPDKRWYSDSALPASASEGALHGEPGYSPQEADPRELTTTEVTLPWKRPIGNEEQLEKFEPARHESPGWLECEYSPSDTVLGMRGDEKRKEAYDLFRRRESIGSAAGFRGSFRLSTSEKQRRRHSVSQRQISSLAQPNLVSSQKQPDPSTGSDQSGGIDNPAFQPETVINIEAYDADEASKSRDSVNPANKPN